MLFADLKVCFFDTQMLRYFARENADWCLALDYFHYLRSKRGLLNCNLNGKRVTPPIERLAIGILSFDKDNIFNPVYVLLGKHCALAPMGSFECRSMFLRRKFVR